MLRFVPRQLWLVALSALLLTCRVPLGSAPRPAAAQPDADGSAGRSSIDPGDVGAARLASATDGSIAGQHRGGLRPRGLVHPGGDVRTRIRAALRDGAFSAGLELGRKALGSSPVAVDPEHSFQLGWLTARAAERAGKVTQAIALLSGLVDEAGILEPWARLRLARLYLQEERHQEALAHLRLLAWPGESERWPGWPGRGQALRMRALALVATSDPAGVGALRAFLDGMGEGPGDPKLIMALAGHLATSEGVGARVEALELYRRVFIRSPRNMLAPEAREGAARVLDSLPSRHRSRHARLSMEDRFAQAEAQLRALRYEQAEQLYLAIDGDLAGGKGDDAKPEGEQRCRARYGRARAMLKRRERTLGAPLMVSVAESCPGKDRRAWARYYAGRALGAVGENAAAMVQYEALEAEAPTHRLADDALWRAARIARDMGDEPGVRQRLRALPGRYPEGDMHARARFMLAWHAFNGGQFEEALAALQGALDEGPEEPLEGMEGRTAYWRARVLVRLGRAPEAVEAYASLWSEGPLTYYGQLSLARLGELDSARAAALRAGLPRLPQTSEGQYFEDRPLFHRPGFRRVLALAQLGESEMLHSELKALSLLKGGQEEELDWLVVSLYNAASDHTRAIRTWRRRLDGMLRSMPEVSAFARWQLAYPLAYRPLLDGVARDAGVPASFVRAVAREESSFDPRAVSGARAYGLVQIIRPTARGIAKSLGLPSTAAALRTPRINLRIGTRFMAGLSARFGGDYALVPSAYNAGPTAVGRWLRARGQEDFDVWVEQIPFDETRRYTRRVLQSYGIYRWLLTGEVLKLPRTVKGRGPA